MKTIATIYLTFLTAMFALVVAGCGGGRDYTQCSPCDIDCEEQVIVNTPETVK